MFINSDLDFEPLTPTPMVVYERPPRTTPPVGHVEKANPAVVIVKHDDYNHNKENQVTAALHYPFNEHGPVHIPIEDNLMQKAKENEEHQIAASKDEVTQNQSEQPETTTVHITPDNGAPGGAVSIVNQVPKQTLSDASAARMVSLLPDAVPSANRPVNALDNSQMYGLSRSNIMQQYGSVPNTNPAGYNAYQGYRYEKYPSFNGMQSGQVRSLPKKASWQSVYNRLLQQRRNYNQ